MNSLHIAEAPAPAAAPTALTEDERAELTAYRALSARMLDTLRAAGRGDLEARVHRVPETDAYADLVELRHAVNRVLDLSDAFIREAGAALTAAGEGRYHRRVLERGMPGHFRVGVASINAGQAQMEQAADQVQGATAERQELANQFESVVVSLTEHVVDSSRQISTATTDLTRSAEGAGAEMEQARTTVEELSTSSQEIQQVVKMIDAIAAQTRLLALNATIEAARVGEAGKGFAVVASEVKELANETQTATQKVGEHVAMIQNVTSDAVSVMASAGATVQQMNTMVTEMAAAVEGGAEQEGLSGATVNLRAQVSDFLQVMRR
ncbi:methyl-accepting chemotaxis protein [Nocardioides sp. AE5]|uniref:methyl-accepting chemotaxis protein n=1 Tax=Nocardioides sp. AE5 TaxID=2962573 RepID=UPI0028826A68|nr:methyl-accepting chemotaxis protein [Nocardioides sp. AE5]MDT0202520.1 methyl-accepting chemotaxis protein [Nocardioides sp. AE5]